MHNEYLIYFNKLLNTNIANFRKTSKFETLPEDEGWDENRQQEKLKRIFKLANTKSSFYFYLTRQYIIKFGVCSQILKNKSYTKLKAYLKMP
jgi:hypothetical protein